MNRNVTATILIVLSIGIYFTLTEKVWTEIKAIKVVNDQYSSALESAEELISVRDKVIKEYSSISEVDRNRLDKMLPKGVDNIRLINDLNNLSKKHGITLVGIKAATSQGSVNKNSGSGPPISTKISNPNTIPAPVLDTITTSFSVSATYQQFVGFLQSIESNLRIMDLTKLSLSVKEKDDGVYDWSVEIKTYWLRSQ